MTEEWPKTLWRTRITEDSFGYWRVGSPPEPIHGDGIEVREVVPRPLARELYEATKEGSRPVMGTDAESVNAEYERRRSRIEDALARYEREVGND